MKLYKFRSLADSYEFTERIISHNEVYFCPPSQLNDPHELASTYSFEHGDNEKINYWMDRDAQRVVLSTIPTADAKLKYISDIEKEAQKARLEFFYRDTSLGILSLSEDWKNLVLWSHYANAHTGICIELEADADPLLKKAELVRYTSTVAEVGFYKMDLISAVKQALSVKHEDWRYEKEWRVWRNPSGSYQLAEGTISAVYFGMNADVSKGPQRDFYELLRSVRPQIKTYKVVRDRTNFQMRAEPLTLQPFPRPVMSKDKAIETLELFILKVDEIEQEGCWAFYKEHGLKIEMKFDDDLEITYGNDFPSTESIKAFLLTYRMFIQKNDKIGLSKVYEALSRIDPASGPVVSKRRDLMSNMLAQPYMPGIPTIDALIEAFIYGNFAHTSIGPDRRYKIIQEQDVGMKHHRFHFIGHLMGITQEVLFPLRDEAIRVLSTIEQDT